MSLHPENNHSEHREHREHGGKVEREKGRATNSSEAERHQRDDKRSSPRSVPSAFSADNPSRGQFALIGAGPGDPELITLKGLRLLRESDVILYDRLSPHQLLDEARPDAERIDVGKFPGRPKPSQPWINELIVKHALAGKRVARLKGGDPFVFGRGGEEVIAAVENDIPVEIVPGVTAGVGVAAEAGVPVTHRGVSRAVAFVTAVSDWDHPANTPGQEPQIDSVALIDTVCIYMGLSQVESIAQRFMELGREPETPAMSISSGCTPQRREVVSTLRNLAADVAAAELTSPVLTIIGNVVALREQMGVTQSQSAHGTGGSA